MTLEAGHPIGRPSDTALPKENEHAISCCRSLWRWLRELVQCSSTQNVEDGLTKGDTLPKALVTGITGQDGSYLADLLLSKGYEVMGLVRRTSVAQHSRTRLHWLGIYDRVNLVDGDVTDLPSLLSIMRDHRPDEVYNLAAQSFVHTSWKQPLLTQAVDGVGCVNLLEATRREAPNARFYQASSSEMFGLTRYEVINEEVPFHPRSPYGIAKLYAHWMAINYRDSFGLHVSCGILFNHESPLRGIEFVSRKITNAAARIKLGLSDTLALGEIEVKRDWGHAKDFVKAMWLMLQQDAPDNYVIATNRATSVRDLCQVAFAHVGLRAEDYITIDPTLFRPAEIYSLRGDASKARTRLGWTPCIEFEDMIREMVDEDMARLSGNRATFHSCPGQRSHGC